MRRYKHIFVFLFLYSNVIFSQPTFNSIDSLLYQNFNAVNLNDSALYVSLLNYPNIYSEKNLKSKSDSIQILKPFTNAFNDLVSELSEMAGTPDFNIKYDSYELLGKRNVNQGTNEKLKINVKLLINNNFTVKIPFYIFSNLGKYTIESPMLVMFVNEKE